MYVLYVRFSFIFALSPISPIKTWYSTTAKKNYTPSLKKLCQCYFVNNSVKHWPNLIIFGMLHREET